MVHCHCSVLWGRDGDYAYYDSKHLPKAPGLGGRDPKEAVGDGALRADLLYRLNVFPIHLPLLRERGADIELLTHFFLEKVNEREETSKRLSDLGVRRLYELDWPGNVRELKNVIERAAILSDDVIGAELLPEPGPSSVGSVPGSVLHVRVGTPIQDVERRLILATLDELDGDKKRESEMLGISLKTLYNRLNVYEAAQGKA